MPLVNSGRAAKAVALHLRKRPPAAEAAVIDLRPREEFGVIRSDGQLLVRFASRPGEEPDELDLKDWLDKPELAMAVAYYLADWGIGKSKASRHTQLKLVRYFLNFLRASETIGLKPLGGVGDMSTEIISMYAAWLSGRMDLIPSEPGLADNTVAQRYNTLKKMVAWWQASKRYREVCPPRIIPKRNPWPGRHLKTKATEILNPIDRGRVRAAALREIEADLVLREEAWIGLEGGRLDTPDFSHRQPGPFLNMAVKVKVVHDLFKGRVPVRTELEPYRGLFRAIKHPNGSVKEVVELMHFSPRTLVPYIVLLDLDTTFNGEGILGLSWANIADHKFLGPSRWQLSVPKPRATRGKGEKGTAFHRRSFPTTLKTIDTPVNLLKALKRFTGVTRSLVDERKRENVFLFVTANGRFRSFENSDGSASADKAWIVALKDFIATNELPDFTLRTLRSTGGDAVHEATGDMKAQQLAMGHATLGMTIKHYQSGAAKQRNEEALSTVMGWRERFVGTGGKADTRNGSLQSGGQTAATPGFGCADPFNPPFADFQPGKLCAAFGACATCNLAFVNPDDPRAYARLKQFEARLLEARVTVDPQRYLDAWAAQLARLQAYWLPKFSERALDGASLALPPFPDLE